MSRMAECSSVVNPWMLPPDVGLSTTVASFPCRVQGLLHPTAPTFLVHAGNLVEKGGRGKFLSC